MNSVQQFDPVVKSDQASCGQNAPEGARIPGGGENPSGARPALMPDRKLFRHFLCDLGISIIPLHFTGDPLRDKKPAIGGWKEFQGRLMSIEEAQLHFARPRNAALIMGATSGLIGVDTDSPESEEWVKANLPVTPWMTRTTKGWHRYYRHPGVNVATAKGERQKGELELDLRGDGGYLVAPGSVHAASHTLYEQEGDWSVPKDQLPIFPAALSTTTTWKRFCRRETLAQIAATPAQMRLVRTTPDGTPAAVKLEDVAEVEAILSRFGERKGPIPIGGGSVKWNFKDCPFAKAGIVQHSKPEPWKSVVILNPDGGRAFLCPRTGCHDVKRWEDLVALGAVAATWDEPEPFLDPTLPSFPVNGLPAVLRDFASDVAAATQTPIDMAAVMALAALGATVARRVVISEREGHVEPLNLYTIVGLGPGNRKSSVVDAIRGPFRELEQEESERARPDIARAESRYERAKANVSKLQKRAVDAKAGESEGLGLEADDAAAALSLMTVPRSPRILTSDFTPEKLTDLLLAGGGRLAIINDEGGLFETLAGRFNDSVPFIDNILNGWNGGESGQDRVKRGSELVLKPAITFAMAVQPDVIRGLQSKPGFRGRGLLGRFLYSLPVSNVGTRSYESPAPNPQVREAYRSLVRRLFLGVPDVKDERGNPIPFVIRLGPAALAVAREFYNWLEPKNRTSFLHIADWSLKLYGTTLRIAGVLHCAAHPDKPWDTPVSAETMAEAVRIGMEYFLPHGLAAFDLMGVSVEMEDAREIYRWLCRDRPQSFQLRHCYRAINRFRTNPESAEKALAILTNMGYIRAAAAGRRDSRKWDVHPGLCEQEVAA